MFSAPKRKHSSFQCIILRKALGAPPPFAYKNTSESLFSQSKKKELVGWVKSPQGQPQVLYPIKVRMGPSEFRFYPRTTRSQRRRSTPHKVVGWVQPPQGQPPVLYPIKTRMGPPEGGSTPELSIKTTSEHISYSLESPQGQPPVLHPIKARMDQPEF